MYRKTERLALRNEKRERERVEEEEVFFNQYGYIRANEEEKK